MSALAPLLPKFLGLETRAIRYTKNGMKRSVEIPGLLEQGVEGVPSPVKPGETFSLNGHTGPRTKAEGYVEAGVTTISLADMRSSFQGG